MDLKRAEGVRDWVSLNLGKSVVAVDRLNGGLVNYVWRVHLDDDTVIVKHAADGLAVNPDVRLSRDRLRFEYEAMQQFANLNRTGLAARCVLPQVELYDDAASVIVMEDMAKRFGAPDNTHAEVVGAFIGWLHASTAGSSSFAEEFDNADVQRVRFESQYAQVRHWLRDHRPKWADICGDFAESFGERLLERGDCIVMGDLWPAAILGAEASADCTLIDWEFVHYGIAAQDIGHLAAHCWMHPERVGAPFEGHRWSGLEVWEKFRLGYELWADLSPVMHDAQTHAGCEILSRTIGPMSANYKRWSADQESQLIERAIDLIVKRAHAG